MEISKSKLKDDGLICYVYDYKKKTIYETLKTRSFFVEKKEYDDLSEAVFKLCTDMFQEPETSDEDQVFIDNYLSNYETYKYMIPRCINVEYLTETIDVEGLTESVPDKLTTTRKVPKSKKLKINVLTYVGSYLTHTETGVKYFSLYEGMNKKEYIIVYDEKKEWFIAPFDKFNIRKPKM